MTDFIDRAKLEAAMLQVDVAHFASKKPLPTVEDYATAVLALLDAETTEEWRHRRIDGNSEVGIYPGKLENRVMDWLQHEWMNESRRVLYGPWLPSEGGEKRG